MRASHAIATMYSQIGNSALCRKAEVAVSFDKRITSGDAERLAHHASSANSGDEKAYEREKS